MTKFWNILLCPLVLINLSGFLNGQEVGESDEEDNTLITVHAEDAFLPSISVSYTHLTLPTICSV